METRFDPAQLESELYRNWENQNWFQAQGSGAPYCIMIPPPNVTGVLHMGHGFQYSIQDALIRYARMQGLNTHWQVGTDHAGIATQMVVERQLLAQGQDRHAIGREAFVEKIWDWKAQSGDHINQQMRRLGISVDWDRACFTMDEARSEAVTQLFVKLYRDGLIYRGQRLVNWDPVLQTAISDLEVISEPEQGSLWHINYPLASGEGHVTIATTRPETLLGDVAVAVHPDDPRYQHLIGHMIDLPLCDRQIPIIADNHVEPEFGSGCVKITPAHDFNDYAIAKRHELPMINIMTLDAHLNDAVPTAYQGLSREQARKAVLDDLTEHELLIKTEPHELMIPRGDRSQSIIEPMLTQQWFVHAEPLAAPARQAVTDGRVRFIPQNWEKTYFQWLDNIEDWCISRQLWWGHRIPAWYDEAGNIYVGSDEASVRQEAGLADDIVLTQDEDVLDTWFSSSLWPFSSLGWPNDNDYVATFYPSQVLVTGFDIIFFWVARMIMMGMYVMGDVPFREVYITPLIRDSQGQKMSKSKGNALDPIDLIDGIALDELIDKNTKHLMQPHMVKKIEKQLRRDYPDGIPAFGTDALRFSFCALASPGRNVNLDLDRITGYRNFCNKLWNAARFVLMQDNLPAQATTSDADLSIADRWIRSRLQRCIIDCKTHFENYRFDLLCKTLYEFTWHDFCDWYLELSKPVLMTEQAQTAYSYHNLLSTLESLLRLCHPIMPFITEAIWQQYPNAYRGQGETIMLQAYPDATDAYLDQAAEDAITWLQQVVTSIRTIRAEMNISPARSIPLLLRHGNEHDRNYVNQQQVALEKLAKIDTIRWLGDDETVPPAASAYAGELELYIPLAGLIDSQAERTRLEKNITKLEKQQTALEKKLANPNFVAKAPADVVEKEQHLAEEQRQTLEKLKHQLSELAKLNT